MGELMAINHGKAARPPADLEADYPDDFDEFTTMATFRTDRWLRPVGHPGSHTPVQEGSRSAGPSRDVSDQS